MVLWFKDQFVYKAAERPQNETFLSLGLGGDQTEPVDLSIWKNKHDDTDAPAAATTLTKNYDNDAGLSDRGCARAAVLFVKKTAAEITMKNKSFHVDKQYVYRKENWDCTAATSTPEGTVYLIYTTNSASFPCTSWFLKTF